MQALFELAKTFKNVICRLMTLSFLIFLGLFSFPMCNPLSVNVESQKIDSLIEIQKVNDQCILIKFGADAITAINSKKGIVLIDAGISTGLTTKYRRIIESKFARNDFAYVINTHGHPDHYGGNGIFAESRIVGHVNYLTEIAEQRANTKRRIKSLSNIVEDYRLQLKSCEPGTKEWNEIFSQKIRYQNAYMDAKNLIPCKQPDITFPDSLDIDMGDVTFEMVYFGKCHSNSDILVYVPEMSILFTGDLFSNYGRASIRDTLMLDMERWIKSIQWIEKRMINIEKIIDGHGRNLTIDDLKAFNANILSKSSQE
jgi:glyoxylase-like metal-dependent hydrolase (beta-lactamase superfamily II)